MKKIIILMTLVIMGTYGNMPLLLPKSAFAGTLDSPGAVSDTDSRMHSLEDVYDYLTDVDNPPPGIRTGVADSATSTTLVDADLTGYANDYYNTWTIEITAGTGNGQSRTVSDFVASTGAVTVGSSWGTTPDSTSAYKISPTGFVEPAAGPSAGTMHTLDEIYANLTRVPATGQTTSYTTGDDGDLEAGAALEYRDNGDGTVTDLNTGLMWIKDADDSNGANSGNAATWANAISHCNSCDKAGYDDWRLPTMGEFISILNFGKDRPTVGKETGSEAPFTNFGTSGDSRWTSTATANVTGYAWHGDFQYGTTSSNIKTATRGVFCVRGGQ